MKAVRFSADGKALLTGSWDGTVRAWEVATGRETRVLDRVAGPILGLSVSPDGKTLAVAHEETSPDNRTRDPLRFLDIESGRLLHELDQRWLTGGFEAAFSPDGKWHAEASGLLRISSTASWLTTYTLGRDESWPRSLAFSPGGRALAAGLYDGTVRVWSTAPGEGLVVLRGHGAPVTSIAYLPDGRTLVTGSIDGTVRLWDPASGRQTRVLRGHTGAVYAVAVSRDGKAIASAGADRKVRLWDAETGAEEGASSGHTQDIRSLAFCGAPRRVVSGALDWTIRSWDFARRAEVGRLEKAHATSVACSPDGKTLFAAAGEPGFDLWNAETGAPLRPWVEGVAGASRRPPFRRAARCWQRDPSRAWSRSPTAPRSAVSSGTRTTSPASPSPRTAGSSPRPATMEPSASRPSTAPSCWSSTRSPGRTRRLR